MSTRVIAVNVKFRGIVKLKLSDSLRSLTRGRQLVISEEDYKSDPVQRLLKTGHLVEIKQQQKKQPDKPLEEPTLVKPPKEPETNMQSWDPEKQEAMDADASEQKLLTNLGSKKAKAIDIPDEEEAEEEQDVPVKKEAKSSKKTTTKAKKTRKKATTSKKTRSKKETTAKKVADIITKAEKEMEEAAKPSEDLDTIFDVGEDDDNDEEGGIEWVDKKQEKERIMSHPVLGKKEDESEDDDLEL